MFTVGWKVGCRPLIGVDGTFLKGKARGILLTAVGIDADEAIYPIAFAVCSKENTHTWKWFFEWLKRSLELDNGQNITIMSDMQKVIWCYLLTCLMIMCVVWCYFLTVKKCRD